MEKPDRFSRTTAINKAQRNGIRAHVPDKIIAQFIKQAIEEGKVRKLSQEEVRRKVESEARVVGKKPPQKKKTGKPSADLKPGRVNRNVIEYNLKAYQIPRDTLTFREEADCFIAEPTIALTDEERYRIDTCLGSMGAVWEDKGPWGQWRIPKEVGA